MTIEEARRSVKEWEQWRENEIKRYDKMMKLYSEAINNMQRLIDDIEKENP